MIDGRMIALVVWVVVTGVACGLGYLLGRMHGYRRGVDYGTQLSAAIVDEFGASRRLRRAFKSKMRKQKKGSANGSTTKGQGDR